jgi:hypothetical protein
MKTVIILLICLLPSIAIATGCYEVEYCKHPDRNGNCQVCDNSQDEEDSQRFEELDDEMRRKNQDCFDAEICELDDSDIEEIQP